MKKRVFSLIVVMTMLIACVPIVVNAEVVDSGTCGDNLTWAVDDEGTMTISGTGEMKDFASYVLPSWESSRKNIKKVVIDNGVTSIGDYAFYKYDNLESIIVSDSVTSIGSDAFSYCSSLSSITLPDNITSIDGAFYGTAYYNDESNWGNGILYIGNYLIKADNDKIDSNISIKSGTKVIASGAFYNCSSLTSIEIPNSVIGIGYDAFENCENLNSIEIPNSVITVGYNAFNKTAYYNDESNWENGILYIGNYLIKADNDKIDSNITIKP